MQARGPIGERKVAMFFKDQTCAQAMKVVASTLQLEWEKRDNDYRLVEPARIAAADEAARQNERDAAESAVREYCKALISISKKSVSELDQLRSVHEQKELSIRQAKGTNWQFASGLERNWIHLIATVAETKSGKSRQPGPAAVGDVLSQLTSNEFERMLAGGTIFAARPAAAGLATLPESGLMFRGELETEDGKPVDRSKWEGLLILRYNQNRLVGKFQTLGTQSGSATGWSADSTGWQSSAVEVPSVIKDRATAWRSIKDEAVLSRPISEKMGPLPTEKYSNESLTIADQLEELYRRTNVPIVAESFRVPETYGAWIDGKTIGDWVQTLTTGPSFLDTRGANVRTENGWIMVRKSRRWRYMLTEPSEDAILKAESAVTKTGMMSLRDYAAFAFALSPAQADAFEDRLLNVRFRTTPLKTSMAAWRLIGSLSNSQWERTVAKGITATSLSPGQLDLYKLALLEGLWLGIVKDEIVKSFFPGAPALSADLALFYVNAENTRWMTFVDNERLADPNDRSMMSNNTGIRFQSLCLGLSPEQAVRLPLLSEESWIRSKK